MSNAAKKLNTDFVSFDIVELVRRCGIPVLKQLPDGQWLARCPFCGDSEKSEQHGHLYLKPDTGEYKCHRCGDGGYAIGFYTRLRGVDTKTAYKVHIPTQNDHPFQSNPTTDSNPKRPPVPK